MTANFINRVDTYFAKNFRKKFIVFVSIPLFLSTIFLGDYFLLPEIKENDRITHIQKILVPKSNGFRVRSTHRAGTKYRTEKKFKFSTTGKRVLMTTEISINASPIFKTVKTVRIDKKEIDISSGFKGISAIMLISCNLIIITSIFCALFIKTIDQHVRISLIFANLFFFILWGCILLLF